MQNQSTLRASSAASIKSGEYLTRFVGFDRFFHKLGLLGEVEMAAFAFRGNHWTITQEILAADIPAYLQNLLGYAPTVQEIQSPTLLYGRRVLITIHRRYGRPTITDIRPP
jgi:hypothetical protein